LTAAPEAPAAAPEAPAAAPEINDLGYSWPL
jgi:hypothetical protein